MDRPAVLAARQALTRAYATNGLIDRLYSVLNTPPDAWPSSSVDSLQLSVADYSSKTATVTAELEVYNGD